MAKVSVIIPVYNVEKYLSRCLESIINQTMQDIEIICVNDGSTDSSMEILDEYAKKDSRIKIINQQNKGLSAARNVGVNIANGEYLGFVDSDDWVSLDFFEKLYNSAVSNDAEIAVAGILCHRKDELLTILEYEKEQVVSDYNEKLELCDMPEHCYVWNKIYRNTLKQNMHFEEGRIYEDMIFSPQILYYSDKLVCVPKANYNYFRHENTLVKIKNRKSKEDCLYAKQYMDNFFKEHGVDISKIGTQTKKYKLFGITLLKTLKRKNRIKYVLLNCIKWERKLT